MGGGEGQERVLGAMAGPGFHGPEAGAVEHVETHISHVFLAGDHAYKIKKPLDLGFLNFLSLESREEFCRRELTLNRRLAPDIYLEVFPIVDGPDGPRPGRQGEGPVLEWCLKMRRMEAGRMMDVLLERGGVQPEHILDLARLLAEFHRRAAQGGEVAFQGRPEQFRVNVEENFRQTENYREVTVAAARWEAIRDYSLGFLAANRGIMLRRVEEGRMVDGHGDLHSGNINLASDGRVHVFDCIEFNNRFRYQDAACDLAFLAMDLDFNRRPDLSRLLVEAYVKAGDDRTLVQVLDFYKCYRAVVRAKIHGFMVDDPGLSLEHRFRDVDRARDYFRLAARYAGGEPPFFLVCCMGLMGSGKSRLARDLAQKTGWVSLSSDETRKRLAGISPTEPRKEAWGQGIYGPEASRATYQALWEGAGALLAQGQSAIVDAGFMREADRLRFLDLAREKGAVPVMAWVRAGREETARRLVRREEQGGSISDGRLALMDRQAAAWETPSAPVAGHTLILDTGRPLGEAPRRMLEHLTGLGWGGQ